jgi:hypothetical protein
MGHSMKFLKEKIRCFVPASDYLKFLEMVYCFSESNPLLQRLFGSTKIGRVQDDLSA